MACEMPQMLALLARAVRKLCSTCGAMWGESSLSQFSSGITMLRRPRLTNERAAICSAITMG
ncbi:MAG TPA: hypothetical protein VF283_04110 [Bryobacteraceae bacterium]